MVQQRARDLAASWPLRSLPPAVSARASPLVFINAADGRDILSTGGIYNTSTYDDCCYLLLHDVVPNGGHLFAHGATAYNGGSHLFLNDGVRQWQRLLGNSGKPITLETLSLTKFSKYVFQEQGIRDSRKPGTCEVSNSRMCRVRET
jgi:hypothetical protein